jgi:hypothetical protein
MDERLDIVRCDLGQAGRSRLIQLLRLCAYVHKIR